MASRPVVYLLPGLLCDEAVWTQQIAALSPTHEVRVPVFRGMNNFRAMARKVAEEAPARFSVVGHSMGGRVAMELMHMVPERIERFVLMDLGVHPVKPGEPEKRMTLVRLAEEQGMEVLAELWIPPMIAPSRHSDSVLVGQIREMVLRSTAADYRGQIEAALTREDQRGYLPHISHKTLLICGEKDEWSPVAQHESMQRGLPDAELVIIPRAGHMVTMEEPEEVNRVLLEWFSRT